MSYLALDLGAGSGRAIVGTINDNKIVLDEVHRFTNRQVQLGNTLYWDFPALFTEIKQGIANAVKKAYNIDGIAVDTWGVDFGLLDNKGRLLSNPVCYRDSRTNGMLDIAYKSIEKDYFFSITGNQFMEINSAFQLLSMVMENNPQLSIADKLLFTPDLFNYFLTGIAANEYTIASTSQLINAQTRKWEEEVFQKLKLPADILQSIVQPGNKIGSLLPSIANETGANNANVFNVGSHDTASAVAAIPAKGNDWLYISSGTWSLMGVESDNAIMTTEALRNDFTNEGGVGGKIRFLRNITGLWLLQCLIKEWEKDGFVCDYDALFAETASATAFQSIINVDDAGFSNPASMQGAINEYCRNTNQPEPKNKAGYVRTVLESLALKYKSVLKSLQKCTGKHYKQVHVVGGGCRNKLLNQYTADALGIELIAGPVEATALGNIMVQAWANGEIKSLEEGRQLIGNSFELQYYQPADIQKWDDIFQKFEYLL